MSGSGDPRAQRSGTHDLSAPVEWCALLDRVEQGPVALLDDMAEREGRAWFLAERAHHPVVSVVAKQDDACQRGERRAAFGAQFVGDDQPALGRKIGKRAASQDRQALEGEADIISVATEALHDIGKDRVIIGTRRVIAFACGDNRAGKGAQVGCFGGGQRLIDRN